MTTNTKLLAGVIALFGIAILISSFKKPDEAPTKKYLTMAVSRIGFKGESQITIMPESGLPDMIEMEGGHTKEVLIGNATVVNSNLNAIADKGYHLVSTVCDNFAVGNGATLAGITLYVFEKN